VPTQERSLFEQMREELKQRQARERQEVGERKVEERKEQKWEAPKIPAFPLEPKPVAEPYAPEAPRVPRIRPRPALPPVEEGVTKRMVADVVSVQPKRPRERTLPLGRGGLRKAVIMAEILKKPVSMRFEQDPWDSF